MLRTWKGGRKDPYIHHGDISSINLVGGVLGLDTGSIRTAPLLLGDHGDELAPPDFA